jgi:hypothetical protein
VEKEEKAQDTNFKSTRFSIGMLYGPKNKVVSRNPGLDRPPA